MNRKRGLTVQMIRRLFDELHIPMEALIPRRAEARQGQGAVYLVQWAPKPTPSGARTTMRWSPQVFAEARA
jgi:hypothetical protein